MPREVVVDLDKLPFEGCLRARILHSIGVPDHYELSVAVFNSLKR